MDPYQLFSTPPGDMVMSSTPLKHKVQRSFTPIGKGNRGSSKTSTPAREKANKSVSLSTPMAIKKKKITKQGKKQKKENLWDEHLKNNPDLAQFVDQFNHSLEEATSKPLDMS